MLLIPILSKAYINIYDGVWCMAYGEGKKPANLISYMVLYSVHITRTFEMHHLNLERSLCDQVFTESHEMKSATIFLFYFSAFHTKKFIECMQSWQYVYSSSLSNESVNFFDTAEKKMVNDPRTLVLANICM